VADSTIGITEPVSPNKLLDSESVVIGLNTVERERVQIAGDSATDIAPVTAADGLLVNLGANNDVTVTGTVTATGPLTDTQLRAMPVPISGTVTVTDGAGALNVIVDSGTLTAVTAITSPVAVTQSGTWDEVGINDSGNSITVDGSVTAIAQPGVDIGDVTINNAAGAAAVNIQDGGNSITVDGAITVSATDLDIRDLSHIQDSVRIGDGTDIVDVLDLTNSNPLTVAIVDGSGTQITSFGGGTQYTEGDVDTTITGTAVMWEDASDTLRSVSAAKPLPALTPRTATATLTNVASSATSVTLLALNVARLGATIMNDSTKVLFVKFGTTASATSYTVQLAGKQYLEVPFGYTGRIDGIWVSANGDARMTELTL